MLPSFTLCFDLEDKYHPFSWLYTVVFPRPPMTVRHIYSFQSRGISKLDMLGQFSTDIFRRTASVYIIWESKKVVMRCRSSLRCRHSLFSLTLWFSTSLVCTEFYILVTTVYFPLPHCDSCSLPSMSLICLVNSSIWSRGLQYFNCKVQVWNRVFSDNQAISAYKGIGKGVSQLYSVGDSKVGRSAIKYRTAPPVPCAGTIDPTSRDVADTTASM